MEGITLRKLITSCRKIMHVHRLPVEHGAAGDPTAANDHAFKIEWDPAVVCANPQPVAVPQEDRGIEAFAEPGGSRHDYI
jgi:hypothetical protein